MPRQLPKEWCKQEPEISCNRNGRITQVREYELITPLFGGGVEPSKADPVTVVRASEIRGQLRFWWRATRGGQFGGDLEKMKRAEDALWGSAASFDKNGKPQGGPSEVQVEVEPTSKPRDFKPLDKQGKSAPHVGHPNSRHSYAAFPLNSTQGSVQENISFRLTLTYPADRDDEVQDVLWAWETFSGIGARTRRGFGAFARKDRQALPEVAGFHNFIQQKIQQWSAGEWPAEIPHIPSESWRIRIITTSRIDKWADLLKIYKGDQALAMWDHLIQKLRDFRQDRPLIQKNTKNGPRKIPGRSRWPEADALRAMTGKMCNYTDKDGNVHDHRHPLVALNGQPIRAFPRAVFGLPLIFQFKDECDPPQITLKGKSFERWASPLIIRPVQCLDGVVGIALLLAQPDMHEDALTLSDLPSEQVRIRLTADEAKEISMLTGQTDVLRAFLDYL